MCDRLLTEIDAQTSELARVDAELEAANAAKTAAEERVGAALEQAAAARVKSERLMEMLSEAERHRESADAEAARDASAEAVKKTRTGDESEEEAPEMYAGKPSSRRLETTATATATVAATNENAGERDPASARLAAGRFCRERLGRAYHPLLASIEARLLHLRSEKVGRRAAGRLGGVREKGGGRRRMSETRLPKARAGLKTVPDDGAREKHAARCNKS